MEIKLNDVTWILIVLSSIFKQKISLKISQKMLKDVLILEFDRPLEIGVNKKVLGKFKDELNGNIVTEFISIGPKVYAINCGEYAFRNDNYKLQLMKKAKGTKKCIVKKHINFNDYMNALFGEKTIMKEQLRFKSDCHNIYTQRVNKIALRNVDNKRLQAYDKVNISLWY